MGARLRSRRDRRGRRPADDHRHEEQPHPRHPQGERLPDGAAADRRLQEATRSRTCRCGCRRSSSAAASPAIDTATELLAYYPVQVEKTLDALRGARRASWARRACAALIDAEERGHPRRVPARTAARSAPSARAPRRRARRPDFVPLLRGWGGVSLVYRKRLEDVAGLPPEPRGGDQGARGRHRASSRTCRPVEADPGRVRPRDGGGLRRSPTPERRGPQSSCRRAPCCVAAGTAPNITYEKEHPGTFELDEQAAVLPGASARSNAGGRQLRARAATPNGFFTSLRHRRQVRHLLRRQPPALRRQRRQGDGVGQARLPARRRRCSRTRSRRSIRRRSRRATRAWRALVARFDDELLGARRAR